MPHGRARSEDQGSVTAVPADLLFCYYIWVLKSANFLLRSESPTIIYWPKPGVLVDERGRPRSRCGHYRGAARSRPYEILRDVQIHPATPNLHPFHSNRIPQSLQIHLTANYIGSHHYPPVLYVSPSFPRIRSSTDLNSATLRDMQGCSFIKPAQMEIEYHFSAPPPHGYSRLSSSSLCLIILCARWMIQPSWTMLHLFSTSLSMVASGFCVLTMSFSRMMCYFFLAGLGA
jgi:hypothetical protein